MIDTVSALKNALKQLREAAKIAGIDKDVLAMLEEHQREFIVTFPVRMDDGCIKFFKGFRVQHNHALGPTRGGTRFHPDVTLEDVKALALWMSIKNALNGVPAGGGKGGVICDSNKLSIREKQNVSRAYIRAIAPVIGTWSDFPGADIGVDSQMMSWMLDEWEQMHQLKHEPAVISGKNMILGGSQGRPQATGLGVCLSIREATKLLGMELKGARISIQGYGRVGSWAGRLLQNEGAILVAVCDHLGSIYNPKGIDAYELHKYVEETGSVEGYLAAEKLPTIDEAMFVDCDVLIPAAVQNTITLENCHKIKAKLISEGANGPITPNADVELQQKGIFIVPDILANGGGTWVAHLERVQALQDFYWTEHEVVKRYEEVFVKKFREVFETAKKENLSMRLSAWVMALRTLEEAIKARGWV